MSDKIRCFIAVEIPEEIKKEIDTYILSLKKIVPDIKWVKASSIHVTLKFLGEIETTLCSEVKNVLTGIPNISAPFDLKISGSGVFPNVNRPRVFWLGLQQDSNNSLTFIHKWIDKNLLTLGFESEKRKFSPHLTLGRVKFLQNLNQLFDYINNNKFEEKIFNISQIVLMQSQLKPTGAIYTPLQFYSL
ncbi:RNA 2',3'-cyclic phosphodiesterase [Calditrichota bacterium]